MENNDNIGKVFKQQLASEDFIYPAEHWDRIEKELDKKKGRNKRFLLWFFPLVGLSILSIVYLSTRNGDMEAPSSKELVPFINKGNPNQDATRESARDTSNAQNKLRTTDSVTERYSSIKKRSNTNESDPVNLDSFTKSQTTYYYFRNSDTTNVVSKDKKVVDSLMRQQIKSINRDSLKDFEQE